MRTSLRTRRGEYSQSQRRTTTAAPHQEVTAVGTHSTITVFDVPSNDELHAFLSSLPLWEFTRVEVTPLSTHPSDVAAQP